MTGILRGRDEMVVVGGSTQENLRAHSSTVDLHESESLVSISIEDLLFAAYIRMKD